MKTHLLYSEAALADRQELFRLLHAEQAAYARRVDPILQRITEIDSAARVIVICNPASELPAGFKPSTVDDTVLITWPSP